MSAIFVQNLFINKALQLSILLEIIAFVQLVNIFLLALTLAAPVMDSVKVFQEQAVYA